MDDLQTYQNARKTRDARFDGTFFVAVKSTGIFCRPICPAPSPMEKNVEYFSMAQLAMNAGYRPCLRCRPDSAPMSCAWKGVDTTVERAISLLAQYPELTLDNISEKLGISDRYLRDLFKRKLGMGPKKFQLYEKLMFAKQLLHQTRLPIEHVAQASGFSSARRLQDNLSNTLGLSPKQIRQKGVSKENQLLLKLSYRPPYHWQHLRDFLATRAISSVESVTENSYSRTFNLGSSSGWFEATINSAASVFEVKLEINEIANLKPVITQIRRILDLDSDPKVIEEGLVSTMLPSTNILNGIRIPGVWQPFEAGCRAILGQQISVVAAIKLVTKMVNELGSKEEQRFYFPTPEQVSKSDLQFLGMPDKRRQTLRAFARFCAENPDQDNLDHWLKIKGIGPWTVAYAKMRGQSNPDIWLDTDLIIKKQIANNSIEANAAKPWRSYLTFQLWSMA